jgi:hypothetical protein
MKTPATPGLHQSLSVLLRELTHGASSKECWVLNRNDPGLLAALDRIPAEVASQPAPSGGGSIAAHTDHLRYGFDLIVRWSRGENPFADADFSGSWKRGTVTADEWTRRREEFCESLAEIEKIIATPRELGYLELTGLMSTVVHLAYHVGAMRQISSAIQGPKDPGRGNFGTADGVS